MNKLSDYISFFDNVLTDQECNDIIEWYESNISEEQDAQVASGKKSRKSSGRNSKIIYVPYESDVDLLLSKAVNKSLSSYVERLSNLLIFNDNTNISNIGIPTNLISEQYSINKYYPDQFYEWHVDQGFSSENIDIFSRVFSVLIYLNDDFEGGNTEFTFGHIVPKQGSCLVFPSNFLFAHRASPVLSGQKYSVAAWCSQGKIDEQC